MALRKLQKSIKQGRRDWIKIGVILTTVYSMVCMWHWKIGLTYFTELSNLFAAGVVLAQLITRSRKLWPVKFAAVLSITVTFLVYLLVLAPLTPGGFIAAYQQDHYASLMLHVITPLLTIADFLINDGCYPWNIRHYLFSIVPPLVYFVFILILSVFGVRWHGMSAPYAFLNYAAPAGWFGFRPETAGFTTMGVGVFYIMIFLVAAFLLLGRLLLFISDKGNRKT